MIGRIINKKVLRFIAAYNAEHGCWFRLETKYSTLYKWSGRRAYRYALYGYWYEADKLAENIENMLRNAGLDEAKAEVYNTFDGRYWTNRGIEVTVPC